MKIISHLPPRHMDDFLCLALARHVYPSADFEFLHPQDHQLEKYRNDPDCILIDIGGSYDPPLNNFDHHHDLELPCSLILFARAVHRDDIAFHPVVGVVSCIDCFGFQKASQLFGIRGTSDLERKRRTIFQVDITRYYSDVYRSFLVALDAVNYDEFIAAFYDQLEGGRALEEAKRAIEDEERERERKLRGVKTIYTHGMKVLFSTESLAPDHSWFFSVTRADLLIERNKMNPSHTSVIKNSSSCFYNQIDLSQLATLYRIVFLHNTGFIAVLDTSVETIDPNEIVVLAMGDFEKRRVP